MTARWSSPADFAEELDHRLEDEADKARRAPLPLTEQELRDARAHATGLERARELLREVLHAGRGGR